jgi:hypothetical protein
MVSEVLTRNPEMNKKLAIAIVSTAVCVIGGPAMGALGPQDVMKRVGRPGAIAYLQAFADAGGDELYSPEQAREAAEFLWSAS